MWNKVFLYYFLVLQFKSEGIVKAIRQYWNKVFLYFGVLLLASEQIVKAIRQNEYWFLIPFISGFLLHILLQIYLLKFLLSPPKHNILRDELSSSMDYWLLNTSIILFTICPKIVELDVKIALPAAALMFFVWVWASCGVFDCLVECWKIWNDRNYEVIRADSGDV